MAMHSGTFLRLWDTHSRCTRIMRLLYLQRCGVGQFRIAGTRSQRQIARLIQATPQERHAAALLALRRRTRRWDDTVPEAVVGAYIHFSKSRPPIALVLHASVACAMLRARPLASATLLPYVFPVLGGDCQTHLLSCPIFLHWLDLQLYSGYISSNPSVASFLRSLAQLFPFCMRAAMSMDVALWASDGIRPGATHLPGALFFRSLGRACAPTRSLSWSLSIVRAVHILSCCPLPRKQIYVDLIYV